MGDSTRMIPLTQGKFAIVDEADYDLVGQGRWHLSGGGKSATLVYAAGQPFPGYSQRPTLMHRFIMGAKPGEVVDHINHDGLDNRRSVNLRVCSAAENSRNRRHMDTSRSYFQGVMRRRYGMWSAAITSNGRTYSAGNWEDEIEAAIAYDCAARYLHGEFASVNFPRCSFVACPPEVLNRHARLLRKNSKYFGVYRFSRCRGFGCFVMTGKIRHWCGVWPSEEDAARAFDSAVLFLGKDSFLNFPGAERNPKSPAELDRLSQLARDASGYYGHHS